MSERATTFRQNAELRTAFHHGEFPQHNSEAVESVAQWPQRVVRQCGGKSREERQAIWPEQGRTWHFLSEIPLAKGTKVTFLDPGRTFVSICARVAGLPCSGRSFLNCRSFTSRWNASERVWITGILENA
jgi:hypothetical protein